MLDKKAVVDDREINSKPLDERELDALIGKRNYLEFLNTRNELYRERKMKDKPPSRSEALKLMAAEPNLMRRPILVKSQDIVLGFDEEAYRK